MIKKNEKNANFLLTGENEPDSLYLTLGQVTEGCDLPSTEQTDNLSWFSHHTDATRQWAQKPRKKHRR